MKIFAISDLHLSFQCDKPMNLFGDHWDNYEQKIRDDWNKRVGENDIGIIAGDISWAMRMEETVKDFEYIKSLNGKKIIVRGNHDYWWKSITKIREVLSPDGFALQNDAVVIDKIAFAGTRGWRVPERRQIQNDEDKKIYNREIARFEMALKDAASKIPETIIAILHYPPFNATLDDSPFTQLCEKYGVRACVFGHLHGKSGRQQLRVHKNGVDYYLTSCDLVGNSLVEIFNGEHL
jgi:predicted phosphohydrolase